MPHLVTLRYKESERLTSTATTKRYKKLNIRMFRVIVTSAREEHRINNPYQKTVFFTR